MAEENVPSPLRRWLGNAVTAVLLIAILLIAVYGLTHASVRAINPAQKPPKSHFSAPCAVCHTVTKTARLVTP